MVLLFHKQCSHSQQYKYLENRVVSNQIMLITNERHCCGYSLKQLADTALATLHSNETLKNHVCSELINRMSKQTTSFIIHFYYLLFP